MAIGDVPISITGNLVDDPHYQVTPGGHGVTKFRVAVNTRVKQGDKYVDGQPSIYSCVAWEQLGENLATSLGKGARVIVAGTWAQGRPYEDRNGSTIYPWELRADSVGPDLRYATAKVQKLDRASANPTRSNGEADPWATDAARTEAPAW